MLYLIGLGLGDAKDITLRGLEAVKRSKYVFLESYTSKLSSPVTDLEELYGKKVLPADRDLVEKRAHEILEKAKSDDVSFLVVGDVFSATTHADFYLRAKEMGIEIKIINNASILTAVGIVGLELYKYGPTTSMPYFEKHFEPETPYNVVLQNQMKGNHTLVLLDIKPPRFMSVNEALQQFLIIEGKKKKGLFTHDLKVIGCARLGTDPVIKYGIVKELLEFDFGEPLHCLIIPGKLHFMEEKMLKVWT